AAAGRAGGRLPEADGAVVGPGGDPVAGRVEGDRRDWLRMVGPDPLLPGCQVPEPEERGGGRGRTSPRGCGGFGRGLRDPRPRLAVGAERHARDGRAAEERALTLAAGPVDELHHLVLAARCQPPAVEAEGDGANGVDMPALRLLRPPGFHLPAVDGAVPRASG